MVLSDPHPHGTALILKKFRSLSERPMRRRNLKLIRRKRRNAAKKTGILRKQTLEYWRITAERHSFEFQTRRERQSHRTEHDEEVDSSAYHMYAYTHKYIQSASLVHFCFLLMKDNIRHHNISHGGCSFMRLGALFTHPLFLPAAGLQAAFHHHQPSSKSAKNY